MIILIGSNFNSDTEIFTFYFYNTETDLYSEMTCRNSFGTSDMNNRTPTMNRETFLQIAENRLEK